MDPEVGLEKRMITMETTVLANNTGLCNSVCSIEQHMETMEPKITVMAKALASAKVNSYE